MKYSEFVGVYEALVKTSKKLEKTDILAKFLRKLRKSGESEWIYLLKGRVVADYDSRELGISNQLVIKAIGRTLGVKKEEIVKRYRKIGDLGEIAEELVGTKKQRTLFRKDLDVGKVFDNLQKVMEIAGKGTVDKKIGLIAELLGAANGKEAKYLVRTVLGDLRVGVADGILRDSIAEAFFEGDDKKEASQRVEAAYDLNNDFASVFEAASKGKRELEKVDIKLGRPLNVMLPVKVNELGEAFRICGKPSAIEHKYDGFRMIISKEGGEVKLFTRRLENVTKQFPDVVAVVKKHVKGNNFILDSEVVGYDPKTKENKPFEAISQRIKRKYDIEKLIRELPVEINVFDVLYHNGRSLLQEEFRKRRALLERIVKTRRPFIRPSFQIVTDSEPAAEKFYKEALKMGEEGIMIKKLDAPYQPGRRVGYIVKLKPVVNDLDFVIVGAEYGSGKRAGGLTSYIVACLGEDGKFLEVGKVSSGLKEKESMGTSYKEMDKLLTPLIQSTKGNAVTVKPKIVVAVTYQNVQKSPSYSSGYALRFPRITAFRPDRSLRDIADLKDIENAFEHSSHGPAGLV